MQFALLKDIFEMLASPCLEIVQKTIEALANIASNLKWRDLVATCGAVKVLASLL